MHQRLLLATSFTIAVLATGAARAGDDGMFRMMDTDNDGRITAAEHAAAAQRMFAMMDTDKDGSVTMAEMQAHRDMMRGNQRDMHMGDAWDSDHRTEQGMKSDMHGGAMDEDDANDDANDDDGTQG